MTPDEQIGILGVALQLKSSSALELKEAIQKAQRKWNRSSKAEQLLVIKGVKTLIDLCNAKLLREVARFDN